MPIRIINFILKRYAHISNNVSVGGWASERVHHIYIWQFETQIQIQESASESSGVDRSRNHIGHNNHNIRRLCLHGTRRLVILWRHLLLLYYFDHNRYINTGYACFTIIFILTGLTTLASSINLLVLHLASLTAEENRAEEKEADEKRRQMVRLEGDIINLNEQVFIQSKENPEELDNISVCSCNCIQYKSFNSERKARLKSNAESTRERKSSVPLERTVKVKRLKADKPKTIKSNEIELNNRILIEPSSFIYDSIENSIVKPVIV